MLLTLDHGAAWSGRRRTPTMSTRWRTRAPARAGCARRISPPALRRHDARRRTAGRSAARNGDNKIPRRLLVSAGRRRAAPTMHQRAGRRWRRRSVALSQGGPPAETVPGEHRSRRVATEPASVPAWLRADASRPACGSPRGSRRRAVDDDGRSAPRLRRRPLRKRCCAAAWCTGCCSRCRTSPPTAAREGGRGLPRPRSATICVGRTRHKSPDRCSAVARRRGFRRRSSPGSRAEVPIVGRIELERRGRSRVSGQVDRLAVTAALS